MTPRQLKQIKDNHPEQDDNIFLLAVLYLQRNLNEDEFDNSLTRLLDETFAPAQSASEIVNELKLVLQRFSSTILPTIKHLKFAAITNSDAVTLSVRLTANSAFAFITSEEEIAFANNLTLQAPSLLVDRFFDEKNNADPINILLILHNLFENYPELEKINAFNDLMLQAELATDARGIDPAYLTEALAAFKQWKKNYRTHLGVLRKILEQADRFIAKYPSIKKEILVFCFVMFQETLADKDSIPTYLAKFAEIITTLIDINDKHVVFSLCHHLANQNTIFSPWSLIEIVAHPAFQELRAPQRRIILNLITTSLNNNLPLNKAHLCLILDRLNRCQHTDAYGLLLQCLTAFYVKAPFPRLAAMIDWIKPVADNDIAGLASALSDGYLNFINTANPLPEPASVILEKQLNKLRRDLDTYAHTSFVHTRKNRAAYLNQLSENQLNTIDFKTSEERQAMLQQTIAELYLHYATIEDASGILSRTLEKRLIKLLQIPKDDSLKNAKEKRDSFSYKLHTFFCAGRGFFKSHYDKAKDPVHGIIWHHLNPAIKSQITNLRREIHELDQQDQLETTLFNSSSLTEERLAEIGESIAQRM